MKMNLFVVNGKEETVGCRTAGGKHALATFDPEESLIERIDETRMSEDKILATRFLKFLGNRRLTLEQVKQFSIDEQKRLKNEFLQLDWDKERQNSWEKTAISED